ncbi:LuxR C-terminal-related transcriptional regulator [Rhodococcus sp. BP22]|uniref:LuxR C-terminal-related transcriptional regulator n=1 Tax=Rhodococcus sp. BP22 TaxID=2758566 RepID=UPI00164958E7|nr:LuxR C-terminal-related transcriptional regulator [Rhodococcus sp. BP22]
MTSEVEASAAAVALVSDGRSHHLCAAVGYDKQVVHYLTTTFINSDPGMKLVFAHPGRLLTWSDVPSYHDTYSASEVLGPAGFHEGASVALPGTDGRTIAVLHVSVVQSTFPSLLKELVLAALDFATATVSMMDMQARVGLSRRELEVLRHLVEGSTNAEIATALFVSRSTVNTHVELILDKLGAKNRLTAAVCATKRGLVDGHDFSRP